MRIPQKYTRIPLFSGSRTDDDISPKGICGVGLNYLLLTAEIEGRLNPPNPTGYRYGDYVDERPYQRFIAMEKTKQKKIRFYIST